MRVLIKALIGIAQCMCNFVLTYHQPDRIAMSPLLPHIAAFMQPGLIKVGELIPPERPDESIQQ
jgi:hypothetical protein